MKSGQVAVVDVREKDDFNEEHIPDAIHLSRGTIELEIGRSQTLAPNTYLL